MVTGFLFGAAIDVVIGELPKLTGTDVTGSNPLRELGSWFRTLGDADLATVLVGAAALAVVFGLRTIAPRVPGALVLVIGGLLASAAVRSRHSRGGPRGRGASRPSDGGGSRHHRARRPCRHDRGRRGGARVDRVLPDRRRLQDVRGEAPLSDRHEILALTEQAGVTLRLARVKPSVREVLERDGVLERLGDDGTYLNISQAVEAHMARPAAQDLDE